MIYRPNPRFIRLKLGTAAVLLFEEAPHETLLAAVAFLFALKNRLFLHQRAGFRQGSRRGFAHQE